MTASTPSAQTPFGNLEGQVALVTGASRGIGRAIADTLARAGALVIGTATSESGAEAIRARLGGNHQGVALNVTDAAASAALVDRIVAEQGRLSILVNNAGITRDTLAMRMKDEDWEAVIDTNLTGVFRLARLALKPMMKARAGRIISITSVVGQMGNPGQANYAAAKAGVAGMSRALAREVASRGITVNCVAPGFIETDMTRALPEAQVEALKAQIPSGRLGQADDIAAACCIWPRRRPRMSRVSRCRSMAACTWFDDTIPYRQRNRVASIPEAFQSAGFPGASRNPKKPVACTGIITHQESIEMSDIEARVKKIVAEQLGVNEAEVKTSSSFVDDLGADSLDNVELVMALEDEFGTEIPDEEAEKITTVQQAIDFVTAHSKS